jgi:hypothetical protein
MDVSVAEAPHRVSNHSLQRPLEAPSCPLLRCPMMASLIAHLTGMPVSNATCVADSAELGTCSCLRSR